MSLFHLSSLHFASFLDSQLWLLEQWLKRWWLEWFVPHHLKLRPVSPPRCFSHWKKTRIKFMKDHQVFFLRIHESNRGKLLTGGWMNPVVQCRERGRLSGCCGCCWCCCWKAWLCRGRHADDLVRPCENCPYKSLSDISTDRTCILTWTVIAARAWGRKLM